eukprot:CAMPEP_0118954234 /NCGR_PEP_ID=MMETSP1169-20130426/57898_1 /TAXON_ID=36882 /ORGANISM="Pyramimonas obovata, Strain CCMP722" /LENGTH=120 /DNA_ID=CAMNT_0006901829 /DNA_START=255 /DNA_END=614 /DNA_ORIENTATION=+
MALFLLGVDTPEPDARLVPSTIRSSFPPPGSGSPQHSQILAPGTFTTVHVAHVLPICPALSPLTPMPPVCVGESSPVKSIMNAESPGVAREAASAKGCLPFCLGPGRSHTSHLGTSSDAF